MIFKDLRLSGRFGKAHGLLLKEKYDQSYELLVSILEVDPEQFLIPLIYEDLGIVEYHRGNYEESVKHMDFCLQYFEDNPERCKTPDEAERLERISWHHKASERKQGGN